MHVLISGIFGIWVCRKALKIWGVHPAYLHWLLLSGVRAKMAFSSVSGNPKDSLTGRPACICSPCYDSVYIYIINPYICKINMKIYNLQTDTKKTAAEIIQRLFVKALFNTFLAGKRVFFLISTLLSDRCKPFFEVGKKIINMLDANRKTDGILSNPLACQFFVGKLRMGRRRRMNNQ